MNLFSSLGGLEMIVKNKGEGLMKNKRKINVREACKRYSKRVEAKRRNMESEADIDQMMLQIMQDAMPNSDVEIRPDGSMEITQE